MFPLSTVLFPHARLPLHVFEPRYQALVADCLAGDGCFGVVLIARGSEVGGGDERVTVGTMATIEHAQPAADGRWFLVAAGQRRLRVRSWLSEEPYPRAVVEDHPGAAGEPGDALQVAEAEIRRARALLSELGEPAAVAPSLPLGDTAEEMAWRLCALAPVSVFDRQRLLEAPDTARRLALLITLVRDAGDDLRRILAGG